MKPLRPLQPLEFWQRLAIVVTAAWLLLANAFTFYNGLRRHGERRDLLWEACRDEQGFATGWVQTCRAFVEVNAGNFWEQAFYEALITSAAALGVLLIPVSIGMMIWGPTKWVIEGRRRDT